MDLDDFILQQKIETPNSFRCIDDLKEILLFFEGQIEMGRNDICDPLGIIVSESGYDRLEICVLAELQIFFKQGKHIF